MIEVGALARSRPRGHIGRMATRASDSVKGKDSKHDTHVLGRSAATGRYVLRPASSKGASITIREANTAVKSVSHKKK
jgi:hypothetical protein